MTRYRFVRAPFKAVGVLVAGMVLVGPAALFAAERGAEEDFKAALMRDLKLDEAQLQQRTVAERLATEQDQLLRDVLDDDDYAGSWIDQKSLRLVVAVTNAGAARTVQSVGADAVIHAHSLSSLQRAHALVGDALEGDAGAAFTAWHVDVHNNRVVLEARDAAQRGVDAFLAEIDLPPGIIEIVQAKGQPELLTTYYGGSMYYHSGAPQCSVGFAVSGGFVTAGHCGTVGTVVTDSGAPGATATGTFVNSDFPGSDMALVSLAPGATALPSVDTYGSLLPVKGDTPALIGAAICRSGYTTGYQCGVVQGFGSSVTYAAGTVNGLTRTNACAWFGDSGGPYISASGDAQGVTSGGVLAFCDTYFQPIGPILTAYSQTLTTNAATMPSGTAPSITWLQCPDMMSSGAGMFVCHVSYSASGPTSVSWFVDGFFQGPASTESSLFSFCARHTPVTVTVRVANLHGSTTQQSSFTCPSDIIP